MNNVTIFQTFETFVWNGTSDASQSDKKSDLSISEFLFFWLAIERLAANRL